MDRKLVLGNYPPNRDFIGLLHATAACGGLPCGLCVFRLFLPEVGSGISYFPHMVLAFFKPYGVLTQFTPDQPGQKTLGDFGFPKNVYSLGRLDMDSEGLLLLSDEGGLNHRLLDPAAAHPRTYLAQVEGIPDSKAIATLKRGGISIQGHRTLPCSATLLEAAPDFPPRDPPVRFRKAIPTSWLELTLVEGKNRQVRRMTAAVGFPTLRLVRVAIGSLTLEGMEPGRWRELNADDRKRIWMSK
jgi:23S rRNA pseudouridine2457 synthase